MKRVIFLLLLAVAQIATVEAADINKNFVVSGHVVDAATKEHIPHATLTVVGTTIGVAADATGHFSLKGLPVGDNTLRVSMVGYSAQEHEVKVNGGRGDMELTFSLKADVMSLDQVVVTSSRTEVSRRNSPSVVSIVPQDLFAEVGAPTLLDGLNYIPGVRVEDNCQNCGFTSVRINGLDGNYTQVLVDSRPMFSALTNVYGLEQIPANMIERVEVIRGGGSAIYGSTAIGGTINVITKTPEYNSAEVAHTLSVMEGGALDNNTTANVGLVSDNQRAGVTIFGQVRKRDSFDANGDGFSEVSELESQTFGIRTFFKTGNYSKLGVNYDYSGEYRRGGDNLDLMAHDDNVDIAEQIEHAINGASVTYDIFSKNYDRKLNIFSSFQHTDRDTYYGGGGDDFYGSTLEVISVTGAQLSQKWGESLALPSELVAGVEYNYNDLRDWLVNGSADPTEQTIHNYSFYAQNEWRNEKFGVLLGVRGDKHSLLDNMVFSPRVNLRYNPSQSVNLRASYSTGFRAPQIFDEDLHIGMVSGEQYEIHNSDDLTKESSQTINASVDLYKNLGKWSTNLLIEGFYTHIKDAFTVNESEALRVNSEGSVSVRGFNVEARATLPRVVSLQGSITYKKSTYSEEEVVFDHTDEEAEDEIEITSDKVLRSPDTYGYITANFDLTRKLQLSLSGTYTGSMLISHAQGWAEVNSLYETPSFFDGNIKISYTFPVVKAARLELSTGVLNVFNAYQDNFDEGSERDAAFVYGPMNPRRFTFGAKLMF